MADRTGRLVLIGPPAAGKSSCAHYLSLATGRRRIGVDRRYMARLRAQPVVAEVEPRALVRESGEIEEGARNDYLAEVHARLVARIGEEGASRALEEAKAAAVVSLVEEADADAIVDFGAGHSIYEHADLRARVRAALGPARVVLLLPCADVAVAVAALALRLSSQGRPMAAERLRGYVTHPSNHALADATLFGEGRPIAELCARLAAGELS